MRKKRAPQRPDELFDQREQVGDESPDVNDEETFKATALPSGDNKDFIVGGKEWRNAANRLSGRSKRTR